jgi:fumarylacetoacetate (FAA) hydrolase family protein
MSMIKIVLEVSTTDHGLALIHTEDVNKHLFGLFQTMVISARQEALSKPEHSGKTDEQLIADIPSIAKQNLMREEAQKREAIEREQREQAIESLIAKAPEAQRSSMREKLKQGATPATLDAAQAALEAAVVAEQERIAQEQIRLEAQQAQETTRKDERQKELMDMLTPELLRAAAALQGLELVEAKK